MAKQLSLRLPDELHDQLKAAAEHHRRSLHADILRRLERDLKGARSATKSKVTEAPIQYASISQYESLPPEATCAGCGSADMLVRDHCHEHGWMRDIACRTCNAHLAFIDRRFTPGVSEKRLTALLAVRNRLPGLRAAGRRRSGVREPARSCGDTGCAFLPATPGRTA